MSRDQKRLFAFVVVAWAVALLVSFLVLRTGYDWFLNGNLRICLPTDAFEYPDGNLHSPSQASEQKAIAWCYDNYARAAESRARVLAMERRRTEQIEAKCKSQGIGSCNANDVTCMLTTPARLAACVEANDFDGMRGGSGNDGLSLFFDNFFQLVARMLDETLVQHFYDQTAPGWNQLFSGDDPPGPMYRIVFGSICFLIFSAMWGNTVTITYDFIKKLIA